MVIHSFKKTYHLNNLTSEEYEILLFVKYCYDSSSTNQLKDSTDTQLSGYVGMLNLAIQKGLLSKQAEKKAGLKNMEIQPSESYFKKNVLYSLYLEQKINSYNITNQQLTIINTDNLQVEKHLYNGKYSIFN